MNLGFRTLHNGQSTHFPERIMNGLFADATADEAIELAEYVVEGQMRGLFYDEFAELPPKLHTFREDHKMTWKEGTLIHFTVGMRTKSHFRFAPVFKCTGTQLIEIISADDIYPSNHNNQVFIHELWSERLQEHFFKSFKVKVDGRFLSVEEIHKLSKNDGFETPNEMFKWFNLQPWQGKIIHWTKLRY